MSKDILLENEHMAWLYDRNKRAMSQTKISRLVVNCCKDTGIVIQLETSLTAWNLEKLKLFSSSIFIYVCVCISDVIVFYFFPSAFGKKLDTHFNC